jgi:hypothetical protein
MQKKKKPVKLINFIIVVLLGEIFLFTDFKEL